jgi:hypothetical protein
MKISRRTFSAALVAGAATSLASTRGVAATSTATKARNVVLVHGLFADGSCWSEVIARLQTAGLSAAADYWALVESAGGSDCGHPTEEIDGRGR